MTEAVEVQPHPGRRAAARVFGVGLLVIVAAVGVAAWAQYRSAAGSVRKFGTVGFTVPAAPRLVPAGGETVYRIDPSRSSITYGVDERIAGQSAGRATGSTNAIAGDIALNRAEPAKTRIGQIVVNVEELHSDNSLRDARIRQDFLSSHTYPLATFTTTGFAGLPAGSLPDSASMTMTGQMMAHARTIPVSWRVDVHAGAEVAATATTTVKLSALGVGPISIAGLVSTGDDVTLTLKLVAVDPSKAVVPTPVPAVHPVPHSRAGAPSFRRDVMPILATTCAACHNSGQVGAEHWVLDTAGDAVKVADGIHVVTAARYMPPWPASGVGVPLAHSKALDPQAVDVLSRWARAGGPLDVPASTPVRPVVSPGASPSPRQDLVLPMPEPYTGSPRVPNDYRCFVLDPHLGTPTFITGYLVTPDKRKEIHHAEIFHISAAQAAAGLALSAQDGRPGWECYAGPNLPDSSGLGARGQSGLIAGWVPGQDPVVYPESSGVLFQPGDAVVFQIHYHYEGPATPDRSTVAFQTEPGTASIAPIHIVNPLGPVEIPCLPGATAPLCDRSAALTDAGRLYGPVGAYAEPGLLVLCHKTPEQLTAGFNGVASSSCDSRVRESGRILGAMGHMHTLGRSFRLTIDPGTPAERVLLDIPTWNFDWQMNYQFAQPLHITAGQKIKMECTWDRSLDPNRAQKYIVFAEGTEDEMCFSTFAVIPDTP